MDEATRRRSVGSVGVQRFGPLGGPEQARRDRAKDLADKCRRRAAGSAAVTLPSGRTLRRNKRAQIGQREEELRQERQQQLLDDGEEPPTIAALAGTAAAAAAAAEGEGVAKAKALAPDAMQLKRVPAAAFPVGGTVRFEVEVGSVKLLEVGDVAMDGATEQTAIELAGGNHHRVKRVARQRKRPYFGPCFLDGLFIRCDLRDSENGEPVNCLSRSARKRSVCYVCSSTAQNFNSCSIFFIFLHPPPSFHKGNRVLTGYPRHMSRKGRRSKQHDNEGGGTPAVVEWHEQLAPFTGASTALAVDGTALGVSLVWSVAVKVVLVNGASIDGIHSSSSSSSHPSTSLPHVEVSLHETFGQLLARCLPALEGTTTSSSGRGSTSATGANRATLRACVFASAREEHAAERTHPLQRKGPSYGFESGVSATLVHGRFVVLFVSSTGECGSGSSSTRNGGDGGAGGGNIGGEDDGRSTWTVPLAKLPTNGAPTPLRRNWMLGGLVTAAGEGTDEDGGAGSSGDGSGSGGAEEMNEEERKGGSAFCQLSLTLDALRLFGTNRPKQSSEERADQQRAIRMKHQQRQRRRRNARAAHSAHVGVCPDCDQHCCKSCAHSATQYFTPYMVHSLHSLARSLSFPH